MLPPPQDRRFATVPLLASEVPASQRSECVGCSRRSARENGPGIVFWDRPGVIAKDGLLASRTRHEYLATATTAIGYAGVA